MQSAITSGFGLIMLAIASSTAAIFTGAACVISIGEHPARMMLDSSAALAQWAPSYKRAAVMQASLVIISATTGFASWWSNASALVLLASLLMASNFPFTMLAIMPINMRLLQRYQIIRNIDHHDHDVRALLEKWGNLHAIRTYLGIASTIFYTLANYFATISVPNVESHGLIT
eukprot:TRINITY_DN4714_c0_g1_i1.p1 TRINITY_DN4714_c0_g1~~TRINITY_DN4714_c0_g1_i1.p1  ORF type:complete len:174 (-),score=5.27 TRINITY_DN4714_c0_g1_i1:197-718(-)